MLKSFLIGVLAWGCICPVMAQKSKADSLLKVVLAQDEDTNKVNSLNVLSRQLQILGKLDTSRIVAQSAVALGQKTGFKKGVANAYNNIGNYFFSKQQFDSSLSWHKKSLALQTEVDNKVGIASSNNNMGNIYFMQGNYPHALESYLVARSMYDVLSQTDSMVRANLSAAYNNIGNVNLMMKNYDSALVNYNKSLKVRLATHDWHGAAQCYGNIGTSCYMLHKYDEALKNHNESLKLKKQIDDWQGIGQTYGNIGIVYYDLKKYDLALDNLFASAHIADSLQDSESLANAYSNIGQVYVMQGKYTDAIDYLNKSLQLGKDMGSAEVLKNSYNGLYEADSGLGRWKEAYDNHLLYMQYRDQLQNDENTRAVVTAEMTYNFQKEKAQQEAEQEAELADERFKKWMIGGGALILLVVSVSGVNWYRLRQRNRLQRELNEQQKKQADAVMETQESERKRIAEDLHDSLGHLLSTTKMHLQTVSSGNRPQVESSLHLLNQASEEIRNITFNLMPHTLEEGGLVPALHELAAKVSRAGVVQVNLQIHHMERFTLEKQSQFNIYRIVQEAVNNILKHADAKNIDIQLIGLDDHLSIVIEDDGKGFDITTKKTGRGLKNIVTRSLWLNGQINIDSSPGRGTTITTEIPV